MAGESLVVRLAVDALGAGELLHPAVEIDEARHRRRRDAQDRIRWRPELVHEPIAAHAVQHVHFLCVSLTQGLA